MAQTTIKAAVVDIPWVLNQMPAFIAEQQAQQKKAEALQAWGEAANKQVAAQPTPLQQQALAHKLQQEYMLRQQALQQDYAKALQAIDEKLELLIANTAKELGFDFVFAKTTLIFGGEDISQQVAQKIKKA